jgi:hypothetical protein
MRLKTQSGGQHISFPTHPMSDLSTSKVHACLKDRQPARLHFCVHPGELGTPGTMPRPRGQGPNIPSDRLSGVCGAHLSQGSTVAICRFWKPALVSVFACFFAVTSLGHYGHSKPLFTGSNAPGVI